MKFILLDWQRRDRAKAISINNIWIRIKRSPQFYKKVKPLVNIGVLVKYPRDKGGIILNQLAVPTTEQNPANRAKRLEIIKVLLDNLVK